MSSHAPFNPQRLFTTLAKHRVEFVLVGALAARLQGFPRLTADADITPAWTPENLDRLAGALCELESRIFRDSVPDGLPFDCTGKTLARGDLWNLITDAGRINLVMRPAGTDGYDALLRDAPAFEVYGHVLRAASLSDLLHSKEATDGPQDRLDAQIIREMLRAD